MPYNTTELERDVALSLGIPMYGADPRLADWARRPGAGGCSPSWACRTRWAPRTCTASTTSPTRSWRCAPSGRRCDSAIVKLNEGVSGEGNAVVAWRACPHPGRPTSGTRCCAGSREMELESEKTPFDVYIAKFAEGGGIVEERIDGRRAAQPERPAARPARRRGRAAVDARPAAGRCERPELPGLRLPGRPRVRRSRSPSTPARSAPGWPSRARSGGSRSTSSWSASGDRSWTPYAIELNLRKGGTTHPFLTLQFLTDGRYDPDDGAVPHAARRTRSTWSRPTTSSPTLLRGLVPLDLFDIVARHGLHFDQSRQVGVVFHMISCLTEHGRVGLTAVGDTPEEPDGATATPSGSCWRRPGRARGAAPPGLRRRRASGSGTSPTAPTSALDRFRCYLAGGRPDGGTRDYAGCRDPRDPAGRSASSAPGRLVFAGRVGRLGRRHGVLRRASAAGAVACRAYLVTAEQFADVAAQEMRREPGGEFAQALAAVLPDGRRAAHDGSRPLRDGGPPRHAGGRPMFTVTNGDIGSLDARRTERRRTCGRIAAGSREAHGWDDARIASYLAAAPGARESWTSAAVLEALRVEGADA